MKSILVALVLMAAATTAWGQIPTEDFEEWDSTAGGLQVPVGWTSQAFGEGRVETAHSGRYAASVWNWYGEVAGYLISGAAGSNPDQLDHAGVPIDYRPSKLTGYYMYVPGETMKGNDSAIVYVLVKHFDSFSGRRDTIGYARKLLGPAATYTPFTVDIRDYPSELSTDSIVIAFVSSNNSICTSSNSMCCYFSVDDITLTTPSGVSYPASSLFAASACIAPNPLRSTGEVTWNARPGAIYNLRVYTLAGALVRSFGGLTGGRSTIDRSGLASGEYLFEIRDAAGAISGRGQLIAQ
jgi:hypothetical protein